jgi:Cu2+-exporting ATPase
MNAPAAAACFHCGEPLPPRPATATIDGAPHAFCCDGCAGAARWIRDADLGDYYALRSAPAARVGTETADFAAWDRDDLLHEHVRAIDGGREITVLSDGMRCAACAWLVDRALRREPGVLDVGANAVTGRIRIAWDPVKAPLSTLLQRIAALGYRPYLGGGEAREQARRAERNRWLLRLGIAGLGAMQAMMFAEALYLDFDNEMAVATRDFFRWVTLLVSSPVVFYSGWPFIAGMARELRGRRLGMDTLIAGATLLAYGASLVETIRGGPHVWFDAAVMFVFFLLAARMLEQRARNIASAQVDALARARPVIAVRETDDGGREAVPVASLRVGDVVRVAAGDALPADGVLLDGEARIEEALLTGESSPVRKLAGEPVFAGTVCREHPARVRVSGVGADTRLSQLARLVEHAQAHRPPLARLADRIAGWFVLALLLAALLVWLGWRIHDPSRAFEVTLALLVVSCPCALSLSIPAALAVAHGALARIGVLALRPEALETLADATDVVFDKTGTLSDGRPRRTTAEAFDGFDLQAALRIAAALERDSGHPLAHAFADVGDAPAANDVRAVPGAGIEGSVEGVAWRLGRAGFACGTDDDDDLWLGDGRRAVARFGVRESPRADAAEAISALRALGLDLHLSSGDAPEAVACFAQALGIDDAHARQSPEQKLAFVRGLQAGGRRVAMVGDGLNDAPVLAGADVSLAVADGAALAQRAADLVATHPSLTRIPEAVLLARRTRRIIRQNLAWALGYNLLALPLAAAGMVTPWLAALGMAGSSLAVTLNALRLASRRVPRTAPAAAMIAAVPAAD